MKSNSCRNRTLVLLVRLLHAKPSTTRSLMHDQTKEQQGVIRDPAWRYKNLEQKGKERS